MNKHSSRIAFCFLFIGYCLMPVTAQRLVWNTYTTDQGLSGNNVYQTIQDSQGFIWFATENGICQFNGYEFVIPVDTSAVRGSEVFFPTEDADGKIWFAHLDGSLWHIEEDTIRAWKYNSTIAALRRKHLLLEKMTISKDGTVWLAFRRFGLVSIDTLGQYEIHSKPDEHPSFVFTEIDGKLIYTTQIALSKLPLSNQRMNVIYCKDDKAEKLHSLWFTPPPKDKESGVWLLRNGDLLFGISGVFYLVRDQQVVWKMESGIIAEDILETADGEILVTAVYGQQTGLFRFSTLEHVRRNEYRHLLAESSVADINIDLHGGWWVTLINGGVKYCKNPDITVFNITEDHHSQEVTCLTHNGNDSLYAGIYPNSVVVVNDKTNVVSILPAPPSDRVEILYYDLRNQRLWCGNLLCNWNGDHWEMANVKGSPSRKVSAKRISADPIKNILWASSTYGFFSLNQWGNSITRMDASERTFGIAPDWQGNLWVTTNSGLRLWQHGRYELPAFDHPALRYLPRDVVTLPGGGLAIGLRSAGILIRNIDGTLIHFTSHDGLASDYITKLYCSPEGVLYACSNAGLSRLSPKTDGTWDIVSINLKSGLPSNEINDVITQDESTWLATDKGLVQFKKIQKAITMPAPILGPFQVNNQQVNFQSGMKLSHMENNITIRFLSLHYRSAGDILYRYRLIHASEEFQYTKVRDVNYANLQPGAYTFEVQAQNEAGHWSASTQVSFEILPAWWQTIWFFAALSILLAGGITWGYHRHLQSRRLETETKMKIRELETKALRAQMNPHFIFNCLNSIQHYIAENKPETATLYLARFARLVRLALHGSVDGEHSLRDEVEMLDSYLALEQLRFQNRFEYKIVINSGLDVEEIILPPMLIQPLVENALLHGMKNKTEGGRISIVFATEKNRLIVTVSDNGPGFETRSGHAADVGYRSVGMMLTEQRLALLSDRIEDGTFLHENILSEDGQVCGARVRLVF